MLDCVINAVNQRRVEIGKGRRMDVELNEAQRMLRASATDWLAANRMPPLRAAKIADCGEVLWKSFADMGWLGLPFAEEDGGFAGGAVEVGVLAHALGEQLVVLPYITSIVMAGSLVARLGSASQRRRLLPGLLEGDVRLSFAHSEPQAGWPWDPRHFRAVRVAEGWMLIGDKSMVEAGHEPTHWVVTASCDDGCQRVFLVPVGSTSEQVQRVEYETLSAGSACDLRFASLVVPVDAVLGEGRDSHAQILSDVLSDGMIALCWCACGAMDMLVAQTADYVGQRKQFGRPLGDFQAVQHKLAEMGIQSMEARAACELAAMRADRGDARFPLAASTKIKVALAADLVGKHAIQLHGAMGVCNELPVAPAFRWLQAFGLQMGRASEHAAAVGRFQVQTQRFAQSAVWECFQ